MFSPKGVKKILARGYYFYLFRTVRGVEKNDGKMINSIVEFWLLVTQCGGDFVTLEE